MNIQKIRKLAKTCLSHEKSGHDWLHIQRVVANCQQIIKQLPETVNVPIVLAAAYTHDLLDDKLKDEHLLTEQKLKIFFKQAEMTQAESEQVLAIIHNLSFSANLIEKQPLSIEGQIVQDADRLDAMGAIGIARTFYYGGSRGHDLYEPYAHGVCLGDTISKESYRQVKSVRQHFDDKLLKLKKLMNTKAGKELAEQRHQVMIDFLQAFDQETGIGG